MNAWFVTFLEVSAIIVVILMAVATLTGVLMFWFTWNRQTRRDRTRRKIMGRRWR